MLKRFFALAFVIVCASTAACTGSHKSITAMRTPCKLREIEISDEVFEPTRETWIASCQGKRYACSTTGTERRVVYACRLIGNSQAAQNATHPAPSHAPAGGHPAPRAPGAESAPTPSTQEVQGAGDEATAPAAGAPNAQVAGGDAAAPAEGAPSAQAAGGEAAAPASNAQDADDSPSAPAPTEGAPTPSGQDAGSIAR